MKEPKLQFQSYIKVLKRTFANENGGIKQLTNKILKLLKRVKFNKLVVIGGFNTEDYVKNAYMNASINTIICMVINVYQKNFDLNKLYYQVAISDYNYYLALDTVLSFSFITNINIIYTIIKLAYNLKIEKKMNKSRINWEIDKNYIKLYEKF